jgi:uroporphyrinogen decarboxylase
MVLTSKERVLMALDHQQPDRVPFDLGGSFVTTINVAAYVHLRRALGLPEQWQLIREQTQSVLVDEDVRQALGVDVIGLYEHAPSLEKEIPSAAGMLISEWGITYRKANGLGGHYTLVTSPLKDATLADLDRYAWPNPLAPSRFEGIAEQAQSLMNSPYAVVGNLGWTEIFGMAWYLRGFENFMIDLASNKEMAHALLRRVADFQKARYARFLELAGDALDVILFCDDMGGQDGMFISPRTYREMIKPYHAELLSFIKAQTRARLMFHSCGSIVPILDDFIEVGMDILNPVQVAARGMETAELKKRYGNRLSFWGAVDTQHVLPTGSVDDVRAEVHHRITDLADGGGYIIAPVHVVQTDVPPENVIALAKFPRDYSNERSS